MNRRSRRREAEGGDDAAPLVPGTITGLRAQAKNQERVSVYLDGRYAFGVYRDLVLTFGLRKGLELDVAEQERIQAADEALVARAKALAFLGYRDRSEQEVRRKLERGGFGAAAIDEAVARLHTLGYLDDAAYARNYARARFERGGYGPQRVRADLMRRGVPRALVEQTIADVFDRTDDVLEAARAQARTRWQRLAREPDPLKRKKKLYDYLLRRGYGYETVHRVVDELAREDP